MENKAINLDAIRAMKMILDDSDLYIKDIRANIFKILDLGNYVPLNEYVQNSLEHFSFNIVESDFFKRIQNVILEEMDKDNLKIHNNESVNYNAFTNNIIQSLMRIEKVDITLDDDFKTLARGINDKFPLIASEDWYLKLMSKNEKIVNMINNYNQEIVEVLIKLTPQLASELSALDSKAKSNINVTPNMQQNTNDISQIIHPPQQMNNQQPSLQSTIQNNIDNEQLINNLVKRCRKKLNEIDIMFENGGGSKSEIAKSFRALQKFINDLNDKKFAQEILDRYAKINEIVQGTIYDDIIFQNIPMLKEIYEEHKDLLNNDNIGKTNEPTSPIQPTPMTTYIGASNEEIRNLINQNNGYQMIVNDYLARANNAKTYEERHNSYFELYEIYQNFRDFLPLEQSNQLREQLDNMQRYLQEQRKTTDDIGVRYNTEQGEEQHISSIRR